MPLGPFDEFLAQWLRFDRVLSATRDRRRFREYNAEVAAANELQRIIEAYRKSGWKQAIGSSGTAKSIAATLAANGWSEKGITPEMRVPRGKLAGMSGRATAHLPSAFVTSGGGAVW